VNGALDAGSELAGYRVTGLLGRGGMGFVYEAEHQLLKRKAALKTLAPELGGGSDFRERFIRESQTVASIDHPNIIPIYDAGDIDGMVYIAMRYVKGPDLEKLIASGGTTDAHEALSILEQVAGALDAAHAHEIIHRDVKPPNVMIEDGSGRIYLMDFGIAKQGGTRGLTQAGVFVGTVDYAAPEQIEAKEITAAADVYAFGGVLYEALTGKKPYERETDVAVMFAHITEPPPKASEARPDLPAELDAVIAKAMAKAAEERYATCREMIEAARAALGSAPAAAPVAAAAIVVPVEPPPAPTSNLPHFDTPLVGRDEELAAVQALLRQPAARLVTLIGLGGTGKSRLALEAATTLRDEYDAAYFVDLAPVQDPELVASAIAGVLGVRDTPNQPLVAAIAERLADSTTLLVLDEFEQVLPAAAMLGELLAAAPGLKLLTTCRTQLRLRGEREFPVPPLAVPEDDATAAESPAVRLFVERAQEAKPSFELDDDNLGAVAEICRRLEGIPLAIELAAARVKLLTPEQIVGRLAEKRLSFLTGGSQQDSLRDAIEWSFNLLDDRGKALFAHMAVFVGGASLETAETVAGQPLGLEFGEVLDGIAGLVDNGLVRQGESADGEPRFRMLETIREYALEKLAESGDLATVQTRHLERYVALAETAEPELTRAGQAAWLERLSEENDNIRAALAWSFESGQVELGLRLAGSLVRFWSIRGLMTEGRRWLTQALEAAGGVQPAVLAKAYFAAGYAALGQGDYAQATPFFEESLRLAREAGDARLEAQAEQQLGWLTMARGSFEEAEDYAGRALELARGIGDKLVQSGCLNILAEIEAEKGDGAAANELYEQSLALRRELGDKRLIANSVLTLGRAELTRGDTEHATTLLQEGCKLARELSDTWSVSLALVNLGRVALLNGDLPEASKLFVEALKLAKERGDKRVSAECLQGLGAVAAAHGEAVQGAHLLGAGEALLEAIGATPTPIEVAIGDQFGPPLKASLGDDRFAAEWAAGRAIPADDAIELGLASSSDPDLVAAPA
jgi:predicted ATPase/predicted Ser/Thr protein kinase/Tfp pilus assembly protein PilF